jgi:hypothetical protein
MPCNASYTRFNFLGFSYVRQIDMQPICTPTLAKFYSCKKWVLQLLPKLNSLQDLGIRFKAMVTEEVVDDAGLLVDGGMQHRLSASLSLHRVLDLLDPLHL